MRLSCPSGDSAGHLAPFGAALAGDSRALVILNFLRFVCVVAFPTLLPARGHSLGAPLQVRPRFRSRTLEVISLRPDGCGLHAEKVFP